MNHLYEEIDEHIQWLINFMNEEYPNNYELVIDNNSGTIRSTLQAQMFLRNDLCNSEGFRKATEKPMNKFVEKLAEVKVTWRTLSYPEMKNKLIELFGHKDMSFLDMVSALYWSYIDAKQTRKE